MITRIFALAAMVCAGAAGFGGVSAGSSLSAVAGELASKPATKPSSKPAAKPSSWVLPVFGGEVVRDYLGPIRPYGSGHRGVDLVGQDGGSGRLPLISPNQGEISFAGWVGLRPVVSIRHAGSLISSFEPACTDLPVGRPVESGQPIAWVCSGKATYVSHCPATNCVHWGMRNSTGYFSPMMLLGLLSASRLLPWRDV